MKLFQTKIENNIPTDYEPKKIELPLMINISRRKMKLMKNHKLNNRLKTLDHIYMI